LADDYAGNTATTGTVGIGGSTSGNIETIGDRDWFRITLTAGQSYRFDLRGNTSGSGTLYDPFLELRDSAGALITSANDGGPYSRESRMTYTPASGGTYYLSASDFSTGTGTYLVSMTLDDYAGDITTTGTVRIGDSTSGNIEVPYDRDWFRITLTAGHTYKFELQQYTLGYPVLELRSSAGSYITSNYVGSPFVPPPQLTYTPTVSGTYYLSASTAPFSTSTGTY
jgi:hypothetical protein